MAASLDELYERDFYAWTRDQARALRRLAETRPNAAVDLPHLIEEVEGLGKSERNAVRSHLRTIIEHCLKLACSPASEPRAGWTLTIGRTRTAIEERLTPTLRRGLRTSLPRLYDQARKDTALELRLFGEPEAAHAAAGALPVDARRAAAGGLVSGEEAIGLVEVGKRSASAVRGYSGTERAADLGPTGPEAWTAS